MRICLIILLPVLLITACSSSKYSYHFDHYDYNSGKKTTQEEPKHLTPFELDSETLTASISEDEILLPDEKVEMVKNENTSSEAIANKIPLARQEFKGMDKSEKKALRKELKKELKTLKKNKKSADINNGLQATSQMDNDLKLAIIFGAVGLTLSLFAGINAAFWVLGVIAIVVGVVFLIKWLIRQ